MGQVIQFPARKQYRSCRVYEKGDPVPVTLLKSGKKAYFNVDVSLNIRDCEPVVEIKRLDEWQIVDMDNMICGDELRALFDIDKCGVISLDAGCIGRNP